MRTIRNTTAQQTTQKKTAPKTLKKNGIKVREKMLVCDCTEIHGVPVSQALEVKQSQREQNKTKTG